MAWIESHQELAEHPKTRRLMRALGVDRFAAVGVLHLLWWWAMDWAEEGDLTAYSDEDIADAIGWTGDPTTLVAGLSSAGFLNADRTIHHWHEYIGRLLEKRRADADRKRTARGQSALSSGRPADVQRTAQVNRNPLPEPKPLPETGDEEPTTAVVVGASRAAMAATTVPALSSDGRDLLEAWRRAHGKRKPPRLNPTQQAKLEEAIVDLGMGRLEESVRWSAERAIDEFHKCISAAYSKRQLDEHGPPNGQAQPRASPNGLHGPGGNQGFSTAMLILQQRKRGHIIPDSEILPEDQAEIDRMIAEGVPIP